MTRWFAICFLMMSVSISSPMALAQESDPAARFYPGGFPSGGFNQPAINPISGQNQSLPGLVNSLVLEAQQAQDNLQYELAGTDIGRQAEFRAVALATAARQFQQIMQNNNMPAMQSGFTNIDRAYASFSQLLAPYGNDAPRTANSLDRIQRLTFQIRNRIGSYQPGSPALPVNVPAGFDPRALADATAKLQIAITQLQRSLAGYYQPNYNQARSAVNDMEGYNRFFQGLLTSSVRNDEIWQACQQLRLTSWDLFAFAASNVIDQPLRNQIVATKLLHDIVCRLAGTDPNGPIFEPGRPQGQGRIVKQAPPDPARGPVPNVPRPPIFAPQPPPPPQYFQPSQEFLAYLNNSLNQSESLLRTVELHVNQITQGHQFQSTLRMLRSDLLILNHKVRQTAP
ncbi:MAG: hypothetical protein ACKO5E_06660, partial [bacterium]